MFLFNDLIARLGLAANRVCSENPDLMILEDRVLYNAAPIPVDIFDGETAEGELGDFAELADVDSQADGFQRISDALNTLQELSALQDQQLDQASFELLVVDTSVEDYQVFVDDILKSSDQLRNFEVLLLDSHSNGLDQISEALSTRRGVDAIHLVTHGSDANLRLGNQSLGMENLDHLESQISEWKYALSLDADILVYGCDVAETLEGKEFITRLSEITESDFAASDDRTGHASLNADWDLEFQVGTVETAAAFSAQVQSVWHGELFELESTAEDGGPGGLAVDSAGNRYIALTQNNNVSNGDDVVVGVIDGVGNQLVSEFVVNTTTAGDQKWATIAVSDAADRFVVVWTSDDLSGSLGVYAAVFDTDGNTIRSEFQVDTSGSDGNDAAVGMANDGSFVVTWEGSGSEDSAGVYARRFDSEGISLGSQFSVNDGISTNGLQGNADVAVHSSGEFVIAWDDRQDSNTLSEIFYRKYDATGVAQFDDSTGTVLTQIYSNPSVDIANNGSFVIAYTADATDGTKSISFAGIGAAATEAATRVVGRVYDQSGNQIESFGVNQTNAGEQYDATALIFDDGSTSFSWQGEGNEGLGVYFRNFDSDGGALNDEARLDANSVYDPNTDTPSPERNAAILNPNDPGYQVWSELTGGLIVKAGGSFVGGMSGAGYNNSGQLVEGFHFDDGVSFGESAPSFTSPSSSVRLMEGTANGTVVSDFDSTDEEGSPLVYSIVGGDSNGVFGVDSFGVVSVVDNSTLDSQANYELVIAVTDNNGIGLSVATELIVEVNVDPVAYDSVYGVEIGGAGSFSVDRGVLYSAFDENGDDLSVTVQSGPANGILSLQSDGSFVYTHDGSSATSDSFSYLISDGLGGTASATAQINIHEQGLVGTDEFLVNQDTSQHPVDNPQLTIQSGRSGNSSVAIRDNGDYVVVWSSEGVDGQTDLMMRAFDFSGRALSNQIEISQDGSQSHFGAAISMDAAGSFVVTWLAEDSGGEFDIYARRFDASGVALGDEFRVTDDFNGTMTTNFDYLDQINPAIDMDANGDFVIAWSGARRTQSGTVSSEDIYSRRFFANGVVEDIVKVNESTGAFESERNPDIVLSSAGDAHLVWEDVDGIHLRTLLNNGSLGTEYTIPAGGVVGSYAPSIDINSAGLVAISYGVEVDDGSGGFQKDVHLQIVDPNSPQFQSLTMANEFEAGDQVSSDVSFNDDGTLLVTWHGQSQTDSADGNEIFGRRFKIEFDGASNPLAIAISDDFLINQSAGTQVSASVASMDGENFVVVWTGPDATSSFGVFARQYGNQSAYQLFGSVLEDVNGDSLLNDSEAFANATVKIYREDGIAGISDGDRLVAEVTTDGSGDYVIDGLHGDSEYWIAVDSKTLQRSGGLNGGYEYDDLWAEQTFGDSGSKFGGLNSVDGGSEDDATTLLTSEHVSSRSFNRANISGVDFGFSFNVVVNSDDPSRSNADGDSDLDRSGQGTLRQFLLNANGLIGDNVMRFVPVTTADRFSVGHQIWEVTVTEELPEITDAGTTLDGRSFATDGITFSNANGLTHGYDGKVGLGADRVAESADDYQFTQLDAPELEISDANGVAKGLYVTAANTEVRYLAIHGFGVGGTSSGNIFVEGNSATDVHIHHNIIGARAHEFASPNTASSQTFNIFVDGADDGVIENNLIGFAGHGGIKLQGASNLSDGANDWEIRFNEIRENAHVRVFHDGIDLNYDTSGTKIYSNLIRDNAGFGVDSWRATGEISIYDNHIISNGFGGTETGGIRLFGQDNLVMHNLIADNNRSGVLVNGFNDRSGNPHLTSTQNLISENSFSGNTNLGIDLNATSSSLSVMNQGDGITLNSNLDESASGNLGLDYPEMESARLSNDVLYLEFTVAGFDRLEVYVADQTTLASFSGQEFGQGTIYLGTLLASDLTLVNGRYHGAISAPAGGWPAGASLGAKLTALAIDDSNNTSEFGTTESLVAGTPAPEALDSEITAIEDQPYSFVEGDFEFSDATSTTYSLIRIDSLPTNGSLGLKGIAVSAGDEIPLEEIQKGNLRYLANPNQHGLSYDAFQFSVNDGVFFSENDATLSIDVESANDAPDINAPASVEVIENETFVYDIDATDIDGDGLFYTLQGGANQELFDIESSTGVLSFKVAQDFEAVGIADYQVVVRVNDGHGGVVDQEITVKLAGENDNAPTFVENRIVVDEGTKDILLDYVDLDQPAQLVTAEIVGGQDAHLFSFDADTNTLSFITPPDFENPSDEKGRNRYVIQFQLDDGNGLTSDERMVVRVQDVSEAPLARNDSYSLDEGGSLSGPTVLSNDFYSNNVSVTLVTPPAYGGLSLNADGTFIYNHSGGEVHSVQFVYQVNDDSGLNDTATVELTINPVDDAPFASNDSVLTVGDLAVDLTSQVLGNDGDSDSRIDGIEIVSQPANGTAFINGEGKLIFQPDEEFTGETSFAYRISSAGKLSTEAVVTIEVTPPPTNAASDEDVQVVSSTDTEIVITPGETIENQTEAPSDTVDVQENRSISDVFADIRNFEPVVAEIEEINLDSNSSISFATYVYATDIKTFDSTNEARQIGQAISKISQFDPEMMASGFLRELDAAKNQFYTRFDIKMPSLAMAGTSFLTVGYLAWMVRGGILLTTFMSSIPAWRMLDPLAVLESVESDDAGDDQSIGQLVDN